MAHENAAHTGFPQGAGVRFWVSNSDGRWCEMESSVEVSIAVAKQLFAEAGDDPTPRQLSALAVEAFEQVTRHLSSLVGELGVRALLARSAARSSLTFGWLAGTIPVTAPVDAPWEVLRKAFAQQDPRTLRDGFIELLSMFLDALGMLIGEGMVRRLLHDVWLEAFPSAVKEVT